MTLHGKATPLLICEAKALVAEFLTQGAVLGFEYSMTLSCSRWTQPASIARMKCQGAAGTTMAP
jgi:hypothetical protein